MHKQRLGRPHLHPHLTYRFQERLGFDITNGAADLDQCHVSTTGTIDDATFDFIGYMRNHLYGGAKIVTTTFATNHFFVDTTGGEVVARRHGGTHKAFVVPQVEVSFRTIFRDKYFTVLERTHGTRIHIDVGVQF